MPLPIPRELPVTTATLPSSGIAIFRPFRSLEYLLLNEVEHPLLEGRRIRSLQQLGAVRRPVVQLAVLRVTSCLVESRKCPGSAIRVVAGGDEELGRAHLPDIRLGAQALEAN